MSELYSFNNIPKGLIDQKIVYGDTSFVYELFGNSMSSRQIECSSFIGQAALMQSPIAVSSIFREEIRTAVTREIAESEGPKLGYHPSRQKKKIIDSTPDFMAQASQLANEIESKMLANRNFLFFPVENYEDLIIASDNHMKTYNVSMKDARHYEVMKIEGIRIIATLDGDFVNINDPELIILTDSENYNKLKNKK